MDDELIEAAKAEAARRGTSLSRLVAELFQSLRAPLGEGGSGLGDGEDGPALGLRTTRLLGSLRGAGVDEDAYRRHLESKHLGS